MDMEKVRDALILSGEPGVTEQILASATRRMLEEQQNTQKRKRGPIEFRDFRTWLEVLPSQATERH
ncbi:unnamed protein product [Symbiodinium natans]|uniref:Uncharacterized protein n=1 Tax=Symbiodinium natans TaxID=878477 RepID=A0A812ULR4_9DINO|nr:unnamed protein product [Symbiodinium natans]